MVGASHDRVDKETTTIQVVDLPTEHRYFTTLGETGFPNSSGISHFS
jgi:hypothetical protein